MVSARKLAVFAVVTVSIFGTSCSVQPDIVEKQAELLVKGLHEFESKNGRLPNSVVEIGFQTAAEGRGPYYEKTSQTTFKVWYGLKLGESAVYDSTTRTWVR